jgi:hypothetical protein
MKKDPKQKPLEFHKGCKNCNKNCKFNSPVVSKEKNAQSNGRLFACNSSK